MIIQILGAGCAKCRQLEENARQALAAAGLDCPIVKITDTNEILSMGVMITPALAIDGVVKKAGRVLSPRQIAEYLH